MVWDGAGESVHLLHESSQGQVAESQKDSDGAALPNGRGREPPQGVLERPLDGRMGFRPRVARTVLEVLSCSIAGVGRCSQDRLDGLAAPLGNAQGEEPGQGGDADLRFPIRRKGRRPHLAFVVRRGRMRRTGQDSINER
jgi:hypothetical protein